MYQGLYHDDKEVMKIESALKAYKKKTNAEYCCVFLKPNPAEKKMPDGTHVFSVTMISAGKIGKDIARLIMREELSDVKVL